MKDNRERPGSGKSHMTAMTTVTKALTEFTTKTTKSFNNVSATTTLTPLDKNSNLVEFLKHDSNLGRDQAITIKQTSSFAGEYFANHLQGGVSLTEFAPVKERKLKH